MFDKTQHSLLGISQKVGQMMIIDLPETQITPELEADFRTHCWGGVILFAKNFESPEQTRTLIAGLQEISLSSPSGRPLIVCVDQEGGQVSPIPFFRSRHPGNMAIGATRNSEYAYESARLAAAELRDLGFTLNLAPVVDVNNNPHNPVIGTRSYSDSPELVTGLGAKAVRGYQENAMAACAKHFPGHGDTEVDSHLGLPIIRADRRHLEEVELPPFLGAFKERVSALMPAHILYPELEPLELPATMSRRMLSELIRDDLGYQGLIITDSMTMKAIADNYGLGEAAVKSVAAGADLVLACGSRQEQQVMFQALVAAVEAGQLDETRLDVSLQRINRHKERFSWQPQPLRESPEATMQAIARDSITLVKNQGPVLPLALAPDQALAVIQPLLPRPGPETLAQVLARRHPRVKEISYDPARGGVSPAEILELAQGAGAVVMATWSRGELPEHQVQMVRVLTGEVKVPVVVASLFNPFHFLRFPEVKAYLCTYSDHPDSLEALADCLFGRLNPKGLLPVAFPDFFPFGHGLRYGE